MATTRGSTLNEVTGLAPSLVAESILTAESTPLLVAESILTAESTPLLVAESVLTAESTPLLVAESALTEESKPSPASPACRVPVSPRDPASLRNLRKSSALLSLVESTPTPPHATAVIVRTRDHTRIVRSMVRS
jgi:hypothetical protein